MVVLYVIEAIIMLLCIITEIITSKLKNKKIDSIIIGIIILIFIAFFGITYIFERPQIKISNEIIIEITSKKKLEKPKAFYHFIDITNNVKQKGNVDYNKIGNYNIEYEVNTVIGKYIKNVNVKIVDSKKPKIELKEDKVYKQPYYTEFSEPGFTATDEYEGDLTKKVTVKKEVINDEEYNLLYEIEDSSGNKEEEIRKVIIIDDVPPEITLNGGNNIVIPLNEEYIENGAIANDKKDGDLTSNIQIEGKVDTSNEGTYYITYKVQDKSKNEAIKKRIVIVKKQEDIKVETNQEIGIVFLTFDDGPSSNITPKILDILKENNIKATFFILNYNEEEEKIIKREYEEGHTIGIHGYSHDYRKIYESEDAYMENLKKLQEKIEATTGYKPTITRFPGGSSNTVSNFNPGIMTRLSKLVKEKGFTYFDWNVSSEDAVGANKPEELYNNVVNGLSKNKRNFVLMHDFEKNEAILEALPKIIEYGNENGYMFEKITEETPMLTHRIFN